MVLIYVLNYFGFEAQISWFVEAFVAWFSRLIGGSTTQSFTEKRKSCMALFFIRLQQNLLVSVIQYFHYNFALKIKGLFRTQFGKNSFYHAKTLTCQITLIPYSNYYYIIINYVLKKVFHILDFFK